MIDIHEVRQALFQVVQEQGENFIYDKTSATYTKPDGTPDCGVGHVFNLLGKDLGQINRLEYKDGEFQVSYPVGVKNAPYLYVKNYTRDDAVEERNTFQSIFGDLTDEAANYLDIFQRHQDDGQTWGDAVAAAEEWWHALNAGEEENEEVANYLEDLEENENAST